jgi:hypothetical protein
MTVEFYIVFFSLHSILTGNTQKCCVVVVTAAVDYQKEIIFN